MATAFPRSAGKPLTDPLRGAALAAAALVVWVAGAAYCHGYERLLTGIDRWPGSFIWSAVAVLPWLGLFEWSKRPAGRKLVSTPVRLIAALLLTGVASMLLEAFANFVTDSPSAPLALDLMRRLPAVGASLLLILLARIGRSPGSVAAEIDSADTGPLVELAPAIDWIEAADNYIELHMGGRVVLRRMAMRAAEQELARFGFVRIHRRYLVNGKRMRVIGANGDRLVRIAGAELPVGRSYAARITG